MELSTLLQNIHFVTDVHGQKQAVQIDLHTWEVLMLYFEETLAIEDEAAEELVAIPGLIDAIEQSKQRIKAGQFTSYQDLKRDV